MPCVDLDLLMSARTACPKACVSHFSSVNFRLAPCSLWRECALLNIYLTTGKTHSSPGKECSNVHSLEFLCMRDLCLLPSIIINQEFTSINTGLRVSFLSCLYLLYCSNCSRFGHLVLFMSFNIILIFKSLLFLWGKRLMRDVIEGLEHSSKVICHCITSHPLFILVLFSDTLTFFRLILYISSFSSSARNFSTALTFSEPQISTTSVLKISSMVSKLLGFMYSVFLFPTKAVPTTVMFITSTVLLDLEYHIAVFGRHL